MDKNMDLFRTVGEQRNKDNTVHNGLELTESQHTAYRDIEHT